MSDSFNHEHAHDYRIAGHGNREAKLVSCLSIFCDEFCHLTPLAWSTEVALEDVG